MVTEAVGLRERTRRAVRAELMGAAMELFLDQGFEQTTIEQISTAVGLSRRSFFRYFTSKDEILSETLSSTGQAIAAALTARPQDEPIWTALRRAFDQLLERVENEERVLPMMRMMLQSPTMSSSHHDKQTSWKHTLASAANARLDPSVPDRQLRATALAGAALASLTAAQAQWSQTGNTTPLSSLLDTAMSAVHPLNA